MSWHAADVADACGLHCDGAEKSSTNAPPVFAQGRRGRPPMRPHQQGARRLQQLLLQVRRLDQAGFRHALDHTTC